MGSFYTNITLRTADTARVASAAREATRTAFIAPPDHGCTVVFDEASESQDPHVLQSLAAQLSRLCQCAALAITNHDDDVLLYSLYDKGRLVDEYNSAPGYFGDDPEAAPVGGDSRQIAKLCDATGQVSMVERALHDSGGETFTFATDRHRALVEALNLSRHAIGTGYAYLDEGELPEGLRESDLVRV